MRHKLTVTLTLLGILFIRDLYALGLSHIQVNSKLNEPLNARIDVLSVPKATISNLKINLASASAFLRAGLERPYVLTTIQFTVEPISNTSARILLTTQQPLKEPFLNFLIEVVWPSGRMLREYTVLLDPPLYKKKLPTLRAQSIPSYPAVAQSRPVSHNTPKKNIKTSNKKPRNYKSTASRPRTSTGGGSYTVARNDTLWNIAQRTRQQGISIHQHMLNIYRANPHAFIRGDMNLIKAGNVVRIPNWNGRNLNQEILSTQSSTPQRTTKQAAETAPPQRQPEPEPKSVAQKNTNLRLLPPESSDQQEGSVKKSQEETKTNNAELGKLRKQIQKITEENARLDNENQYLKNNVDKTTELVKTMKTQLDELNNMLALQHKQLAELQTQLKRQAQENQKLKKQLVELRTSPDNEKIAPFTPRPTFPAPQVAMKEAESTDDKPQTIGTGSQTKPVMPQTDEAESQAPKQPATDTVDKPEEQPKSPDADDNLMGDKTLPTEEPTVEEPTVIAEETTAIAEEPIARESPPQPPSTKTPPIEEEEEPSLIASANELVEQVPGGWLTISGIGGGTLLLFLIGGFLKRQSTKSGEPPEWKGGTQLTEEELQEELARLDAEAKSSEMGEFDEFTSEQKMGSTSPANLEGGQPTSDDDNRKTDFEDVDPNFDQELHEEVGVYIAYNRFDQAENLLKSAIEQYPNHHEYRLKLLEIHAEAKETDKFEQQAKLLHDAVNGQGPLWDSALELWQKLSPDKELEIQEGGQTAGIATAAGIAGAAAVGAVAAAALTGEDETDDEVVEATGLEEEFDINDMLSEESTSDTLSEESALFDTETGESDEQLLEEGISLDIETGSDDNLSLGLDDNLSLDAGDDTAVGSDDELSLDDGLSLDMESGSDDDLSLDLDDDLTLDTGEETSTDTEKLSLDDDLSLDTETGSDDDLSLDLDDDLALDTGGEETVAASDDELTLDDDLTLDTESGSNEVLLLDDNLTLDDSEPGDTENDELDLAALGLDEELTGELLDLDTQLDTDDPAAETELAASEELDNLLDQLNTDGTAELEETDIDLDSTDEISGQFDLAQMFIDMDDNESARTILEEISETGNEEQKLKAQELLAKIA